MTTADELFVESSAVVAWLVGEARGPEVARILRAARTPWISALAVPECMRAMRRAATLARLDAATVQTARRRLSRLASGCRVIPVDAEILDRAAGAFPVEPVRTLDAIHLASLERVRQISPAIVMLSLDDRVRQNASQLGVSVTP